MLCSQAREAFVSFGVDDSSLFDPADFVLFGLHPKEPASVLEDFKRLSVHNFADAIGYGRNAIVKVHLPSGDIDGLMRFVAQAVASCSEEKKAHSKQSGNSSHTATDG
jgi:hypothetical protein